MITDPQRHHVYSNLGWVDHGGLWILDVRTGSERLERVSDARYLTILSGAEGHFAIVHHFDGSRLLVTVQTYEQPTAPLASIEIRGWAPKATGDAAAWAHAPSAFVGYLNGDATGASGYYVLRVEDLRPKIARLDWFNSADYDLGYQAIVGVTLTPRSDELVFGVQRSSQLVRCTTDGARVLGKVQLSGHVGNPDPRFRSSAPELLATDYDVLACVDATTWQVSRSYDGGAGDGLRHFIGSPWWPDDEQVVVVSRPAAGDVMVLDMASLRSSAGS
ncbi:MAG: hypothetical protein WBD38_01525 [Candidatus Dormiibacterota bacterium]